MLGNEETNNFFYSNLIVILMIAIIIIVLFVLLYFIGTRIGDFLGERNYIKMEMQRTDGNERLYWKRKLKLLYLQSIPIIGGLLCRWYINR